MKFGPVFFLLGRLLVVIAVTLLVPAGVAYFHDGPDFQAFLISAGLALVAGLTLQRVFKPEGELILGRREAFVLVATAWGTASLVGAIPWVLVNGPLFAIDALFESTSGFTTTGATILTDIEAQPAGLLLWRSLTQWLGGMGIIVLGIAILPKLAVGGMELLGAEAPGPTTEKLTPRIAQTAKALWAIYAGFTLAEALILMALGVGVLDAVNHAMTTMATGGFSTLNASIAGFDSFAIEMVIAGFIMIAGANFALHFQWIRGRPGPLFGDSEFRSYVSLLSIAIVLLVCDLMINQGEGLVGALRYGVFQATAIMTGTGYATADFDAWPHFARALLFLLMFVGGCAGSTSGSIKVARWMIALRKIVADLKRILRPHAVIPVRLGQRAIPEAVVASVTTFLILFLSLFALGGLALSLMGHDMITAFSASAACLGNVGPGFGLVGPTQNYAFFEWPAKLVLMAMMVIGRLELYTILVMLFVRPRRWRR
ncbi:MAG: TrkH family potassium uptake protein [Acidobacteria bacterium]|nr:TrkH family potassium uptake protein [Acidobacteriota bacterium]